ncbi:MAG: VanZ family protein [Gemmataceae bacterium]
MTPPTRATYAALAAVAALFILYGSWVPFDFRAPPGGDPVGFFAACLRDRVAVHSRSDGVGNVGVAVPLGFFLLAAARVDRRRGIGELVAALALWPLAAAVAVAAEFGQVFLPTRYATSADVWCQAVGAALGMLGWLVAGRWLTGHARAVWERTQPRAAAARLLAAYLLWVAAAQALPLDLTASPAEVYRKARDRVVYVPFREFGPGGPADAGMKFLKVAGLFLPAGLLAGRLWANPLRPLALGVLLAGATELGQLVVNSRVPSATDVVAGTTGVLLGWAAVRFGSRGPCVAAWLAALAVIFWAPFDFMASAGSFGWLPGRPLEGHPLFALEDALVKLALFAPVGAAAGRWGALAGGLAALAVELGQLFLPAHVPGVSDVLVGALGGAAGGWAARRAFSPILN